MTKGITVVGPGASQIITSNYIFGTNENDSFVGDQAEDRLYGMDGDDTIYGYGGDDYIEGGNGNDLIEGGDDDDVVVVLEASGDVRPDLPCTDDDHAHRRLTRDDRGRETA